MNDYLEFLRERLGSNWVLARRSPRILARYGENVNCVGRKRYAEIEREYRMQFGDPYDKARAAMYLALVQAEKAFAILVDDEMIPDPDSCRAMLYAVRQALEAERATFSPKVRPAA